MSYLLRLYPKSFADISTQIRLSTFFEAAMYECTICAHQGEIYSLDRFANGGFETCTMTCPCCGEIKLNEFFVTAGLIIRTDYPDENGNYKCLICPRNIGFAKPVQQKNTNPGISQMLAALLAIR